MSALDPLKLNLHGLNLIEASAGTGKTYTLTTLYLRLLLESQLKPANILVVTFTKAATEALRERVRRRITDAIAYLETGGGGKSADPVLIELLARQPDPAAALNILANALSSMDQAAIYTIHGFCLQMLKQYAFESNMDFVATFVENDKQLRRAVVMDVWRRRLAEATLEETVWILDQWSNPDDLLEELYNIITQDELRLLPPADAASMAKFKDQIQAKFTQLRTLWLQERTVIIDLLKTSKSINRHSYTGPVIAKAIASMDALVTADDLPEVLPKNCERLSIRKLMEEKSCKPGTIPPSHLLFDLYAEIEQMPSQLANLRYAEWIQNTLLQIRQALSEAKTTKKLLAPDDLLSHLDTALDGPNAEALATAIRHRFPVALIDEFQDTDQKQYRIFHRIYHDQPHHSLFLIGDPKQAIYSFRNADVFTYMGARNDALQQQAEHTLGTNWRSTSPLVTAVNTLFNNIPSPFIYEAIPFQAVSASSNADRKPLIIHGKKPIPLQFWTLPVTETNSTKDCIHAGDAVDEAARACAEYIATLLQAADAQQATIGSRPVCSGDIAVLVRTRKEGELMQKALRACNVNSVTLSDDSVFKSDQADELYSLLTAIATPNSEGAVKMALATTILGWNAARIAALSKDIDGWEAVLAQFQNYRQLWLEYGPMLTLQRLLTQEQVPQRLLQRQDGERWLSNLLQLAEVLQTASLEYIGIEGLLNWFDEQKSTTQSSDDQNSTDTQQLRLESDAGLVKVLTMHKSKGLEYPIVFIPFPWSIKPHPSKIIKFHDPVNLTPCIDFGSNNQASNKNLHIIEDKAENARLFYVAVTRAANLCVLCWGNVNKAEESAPALLLHPDLSQPANSRLKSLTAEELKADIIALAAIAPECIAVLDLPAPSGIRWAGVKTDPNKLQAAQFGGKIDNNWSVTSYSRLVQNDQSLRPDHDTATPPPNPLHLTGEGELGEVDQGGVNSEDPADLIFAFPAGAEAGLYLHALLEKLDFATATPSAIHNAVQKLLPSYASLTRNTADNAPDWGQVAAIILNNCLDTPLETVDLETSELQPPMRLRDITWDNRISELEFHFPLGPLTPKVFNTALAPFAVYQDSAAGLEFTDCQGLMHGFIDLIFRHRGRYYVVDYKSNRLGMHLSAYNRAAMTQAIKLHRYDLQYLIYSVALHRFLTQRLPNYNYDQHFGGVFYLFLRGMRPGYGSQYGVYFDRPSYKVIDVLNTLFG